MAHKLKTLSESWMVSLSVKPIPFMLTDLAILKNTRTCLLVKVNCLRAGKRNHMRRRTTFEAGSVTSTDVINISLSGTRMSISSGMGGTVTPIRSGIQTASQSRIV